MYLHIRQRTRYAYSEPVTLQPHTLRLRPREDGAQRLLHFHQQIHPAPRRQTGCLGIDGSVGTTAWFDGQHAELRIDTESVVQTTRTEAQDYEPPLRPIAQTPVVYPQMDRAMLAPYRQVRGEAEAIHQLATELLREVEGDVPAFLECLAQRIDRDLDQIIRETDVGKASRPLPPDETLRRGKAACRDLAELFVEVCRSVGLAMRFVSGYAADDPEHKRFMHAWAEVYLPGPGWRGYDPSSGVAVTDRHVAIAAGLHHENAAPVTGTYLGEPRDVDLDYTTRVRHTDDPDEAAAWLQQAADGRTQDDCTTDTIHPDRQHLHPTP